MIIINSKSSIYETKLNSIYCFDNNYIESIEYINNEFDDVIIKYNSHDNLYCFNLKNKIHNPIEPAIICYYKNSSIFLKRYFVDGKHHRLDGPAFIKYNIDGTIIQEEYWVNNNKYSKEEFQIIKNDYFNNFNSK